MNDNTGAATETKVDHVDEDKRLDGLRAYHAQRERDTELKLNQALLRLKAQQTGQDGKRSVISKVMLAMAADVNVNTVVKKVNGAWKFASVNLELEAWNRTVDVASTRADEKNVRIRQLRRALAEQTDANRQLLLSVKAMGDEVLRANEEVRKLMFLRGDNERLRAELYKLRL